MIIIPSSERLSGEAKQTGRHLCSVVIQLLGDRLHYVLDMLLQLTQLGSQDGAVVMPLARLVFHFLITRKKAFFLQMCGLLESLFLILT